MFDLKFKFTSDSSLAVWLISNIFVRINFIKTFLKNQIYLILQWDIRKLRDCGINMERNKIGKIKIRIEKHLQRLFFILNLFFS